MGIGSSSAVGTRFENENSTTHTRVSAGAQEMTTPARSMPQRLGPAPIRSSLSISVSQEEEAACYPRAPTPTSRPRGPLSTAPTMIDSASLSAHVNSMPALYPTTTQPRKRHSSYFEPEPKRSKQKDMAFRDTVAHDLTPLIDRSIQKDRQTTAKMTADITAYLRGPHLAQTKCLLQTEMQLLAASQQHKVGLAVERMSASVEQMLDARVTEPMRIMQSWMDAYGDHNKEVDFLKAENDALSRQNAQLKAENHDLQAEMLRTQLDLDTLRKEHVRRETLIAEQKRDAQQLKSANASMALTLADQIDMIKCLTEEVQNSRAEGVSASTVDNKD